MSAVMPTIRDRLIAARASLLLRLPFFGVLASYLELKPWTEPHGIATDGKRALFFNEEILREYDDDQLKGAVIHEILHIVLGHTSRQEQRLQKRWNYATDYAVNQMIRDQSLPMPRKPLLDARFKGMSSERIYTLLQDQGSTSESKEEREFSHGIWEKDPDGEWTVRIRSALAMAKSRGSITAGLEDRIDALLNPELPWHQLLRRWLTDRARANYTYAPPNRRYLQQGLVLPTLSSQTLGKVAIGFDTSGSMDLDEMRRGLAEILSLRDHYTVDLVLVQTDCEVKSITEVTANEVIDALPVKGGGGTDFRPVIEIIEHSDAEFGGLIYFTDGIGTYPEEAPRFPVLWVLTGGRQVPPWGEWCRISDDDDQT